MRVARRPRSLLMRFRGGWRGDVMAGLKLLVDEVAAVADGAVM